MRGTSYVLGPVPLGFPTPAPPYHNSTDVPWCAAMSRSGLGQNCMCRKTGGRLQRHGSRPNSLCWENENSSFERRPHSRRDALRNFCQKDFFWQSTTRFWRCLLISKFSSYKVSWLRPLICFRSHSFCPICLTNLLWKISSINALWLPISYRIWMGKNHSKKVKFSNVIPWEKEGGR